MDHRAARERDVEEPRPKKIEWVLVDDPRDGAGVLSQVLHASQRRSTEEIAIDPHPRGFQSSAGSIPELDLAGAAKGWAEAICSTNVVPERGMPKISTGVGSGF